MTTHEPYDPEADDPVYHSIFDLLDGFGWRDLDDLDALAMSIDDVAPISDGYTVYFDVGGEVDDVYFFVIDTLGVGLTFPLRRSDLIDTVVGLESDLLEMHRGEREARHARVLAAGRSTITPIWFLDVDGVINAAGEDLAPHLVRTEATTEGRTWPIHYSPEVVAFINLIHRNGLADIRWLTTWSQDARTSLAPAVGLDDFAAYDMYDSDDWWKAEVVTRSIREEGRPVIWTDDDISDYDVTFLDDVEVLILVISPATAGGLVSSDLRKIVKRLTP